MYRPSGQARESQLAEQVQNLQFQVYYGAYYLSIGANRYRPTISWHKRIASLLYAGVDLLSCVVGNENQPKIDQSFFLKWQEAKKQVEVLHTAVILSTAKYHRLHWSGCTST